MAAPLAAAAPYARLVILMVLCQHVRLSSCNHSPDGPTPSPSPSPTAMIANTIAKALGEPLENASLAASFSRQRRHHWCNGPNKPCGHHDCTCNYGCYAAWTTPWGYKCSHGYIGHGGCKGCPECGGPCAGSGQGFNCKSWCSGEGGNNCAPKA